MNCKCWQPGWVSVSASHVLCTQNAGITFLVLFTESEPSRPPAPCWASTAKQWEAVSSPFIDRVYYRQIQLAPERQCLTSFWGPADAWRAGHFNMNAWVCTWGAVPCAIRASAYLQGRTCGRAVRRRELVCVLQCTAAGRLSVPLFQPACRNH